MIRIDISGSINISATCVPAPGGGTIFQGLTAGSTTGSYPFVGHLPTGWDGSTGSADMEIDAATHTDDGIECFTVTFSAEEEESFTIIFPNGLAGVAALVGQTWKTEAYIRQDAITGDAEIDTFSLSVETDQGSIGADGTAPTDGGDLSDSYRFVNGLADNPATSAAYGKLNMILVGPGTITLTLAMKFSRVS